jgi:hypothetical protein
MISNKVQLLLLIIHTVLTFHMNFWQFGESIDLKVDEFLCLFWSHVTAEETWLPTNSNHHVSNPVFDGMTNERGRFASSIKSYANSGFFMFRRPVSFCHILVEITMNLAQKSYSVATRSKAWAYSRSLPGIAGSNLARGMGVVSHKCCVLSGMGLCNWPIPRP